MNELTKISPLFFQAKKEKDIGGDLKGDGMQNGGTLVVSAGKLKY